MCKEVYKLLVLYVLIVLVIVIRILAESTTYISPDSTYYLAAATHLMKGDGLIAPSPEAPYGNVYFAIWPAGYPFCIAGMGLLLGVSALVASKLVNLFFLGCTFILLYRWFKEKAWFVALCFCSYGMLEIYSYTWSEAPFLFFVLCLCYAVSRDFIKDSGPRVFFQLFICLVALFLFRYAGLIYFLGVGILLLFLLYKRQWLKASYYFSALFFASVFVGGYLLLNKEMTGYYTGIGDRMQPQQESLGQFMLLLIRGLWNQFTLARQYFFGGAMDVLYLALLLIQLTIVAVLVYFRKKMNASFVHSMEVKMLLLFALFYLLCIVALRKLQPFDAFDYRIMSPFSLLLFVALLGRLTMQDAGAYFKKVQPWIVGFMLLSLVVNLPKKYLIDWVKSFF